MATQTIDYDPPGYVNKQEAMKILGKSDTTLERLVREKLVESMTVPRQRRKPERLFLVSSLDVAAKNLNAPPNPQTLTKPKTPAKAELVVASDAAALVREWIESIRNPKLQPTQKLWLNLEEAQALSGLGRNTLLDLCREGRITAFKERGWRIRRASLEAFAG